MVDVSDDFRPRVHLYTSVSALPSWGEILHSVPPQLCIVIDVLRATSTIVTAVANGASGVFLATSPDHALHRFSTEFGESSSTLLAGSCQGGAPVSRLAMLAASLSAGKSEDSSDDLNSARSPPPCLGNSPSLFTPEAVHGRNVVLTTTNGVRALVTVGQWGSHTDRPNSVEDPPCFDDASLCEAPTPPLSPVHTGSDTFPYHNDISHHSVPAAATPRSTGTLASIYPPPRVVVCSLLNLSAVALAARDAMRAAKHLHSASSGTISPTTGRVRGTFDAVPQCDIAIVCSGGSGTYAVEDGICGGALLSLLVGWRGDHATRRGGSEELDFDLNADGFEALRQWDAVVASACTTAPREAGHGGVLGGYMLARARTSRSLLTPQSLTRLLGMQVEGEAPKDGALSREMALDALDFAVHESLSESLHGGRLTAGGYAHDVVDCSAIDRFDVVPSYEFGRVFRET